MTKDTIEKIIANNRRPFAVHQLWVEFSKLKQERDDADDYIRAIWKQNLLPTPMSHRLLERLSK